MGIWQRIEQWIKQWLAGPPDVYHVRAPEDSDNDAAMRAALRELKQRADRREHDKQRLVTTFDTIDAIHRAVESQIHADAADESRSARGIVGNDE